MQNIIHGDCLEEMCKMEPNSIDFIVTDPPYGLNFMGKDWDGEVPNQDIWAEALRVCKPGSMLAAFGGSRTHHHLMIALERAGWEIRDVIMWIYGQGFPKSMDISKAIDKSKGLERQIIGKKIGRASSPVSDMRGGKLHAGGVINGGIDCSAITGSACELSEEFSGYGTALKPAYEPIIIAMKPIEKTFAFNAEKWGVAGINVDDSRVGNEERFNGPATPKKETFNCSPKSGIDYLGQVVKGRWPANIIFDEEAAERLDEMSGVSSSRSGGLTFRNKKTQQLKGLGLTNRTGHDDSGGASRFFYCAKASSSERNRRLEGMPLKQGRPLQISNWDGQTNGSGEVMGKSKPQSNFHPTVKPIALMKYILKLLAPPGNPICLDPFAGSGSTLVAAQELGIRCIGIEKQEEYFHIAEKRIESYVRK